MNLLELEQLVAFADCGRLSKAAEKPNVSQPTITRTMQHLKEVFGVPLFERSKNRIAVNKTRLRAVEHARALLKDAERIEIPITDPEADVTFYLVYRTGNKTYADAFRRIAAAICPAADKSPVPPCQNIHVSRHKCFLFTGSSYSADL